MSIERALTSLLEPAAAAVAQSLGAVAGTSPAIGETEIVAGAPDRLPGIEGPVIAVRVSDGNGVLGEVLLATTLTGARAFGAGIDGFEAGSGETLEDSERAALGAALGPAVVAASAAIGVVLDQSFAAAPPALESFDNAAGATAGVTDAPHTARVSLTLGDGQWRLLVLVPGASEGSVHDALGAGENGRPPVIDRDDTLAESLRGLPVQLEAELGRTQMPIGRLVSLPAGAVVELDRRSEEPLQIFVNGLPFATGRLIVVDGTEWAVQLEEVAGVAAAAVTGQA